MCTPKAVFSYCSLVFICILCGCGSYVGKIATNFQLAVQTAGNGSGVVASSPAGINCGKTCSATFDAGAAVTLTATASPGSSFAGWSGACTGTGACSVTLTADAAVTATFNTSAVPPVQLTVKDAGAGSGTVTSSPSGISCGSTCTASFPSGTAVTLTATPASNSTFTGWSGACTGTAACTVNLSANTSVTANFDTSAAPPVQLTVQDAGTGTGTVTSTPSGINCGSTCTASFPSGTAVTLTATAAAGSSFAGWTGACTGTAACTVTLSAAASVTATFNTSTAPPVQLTVKDTGAGSGTVASSPSGINCGSTCTASFPSGSAVTLTATAASNSTFTGWSGACTGTAACTVTLSADTSVTANFDGAAPPPDQLTVQLAGAGSGAVTSSPAGISCGSTCTANFASGTAVTLTATPDSNSTFSGWSGACTGTAKCTLTITANTSVTATFAATPPPVQVTVQLAGSGSGTVTSSPSGINCGSTCSASFANGTAITLTANAATGSTFSGWSGACTGSGTCTFTPTADTTVTATFDTATGLSAIQHVIFFAQENRSFDNYFGALRQYWADNGYPDQSFDGLPQFNPPSGASPLQGPAATNPGCDPNAPPPSDCVFDPSNPITSFHLKTMCTENTSPSWNEAHVDWDYNDQTGNSPATLNGFGWTTGHDSRAVGFFDVNGIRSMGYYDGADLNYYYFMASNFATSDRWFHPVMTRTNSNREYLIAATSQGYAYPKGTNSRDSAALTAKTIFEELTDAGISWKIYINPKGSSCSGPPYDPACLMGQSYLKNFTYAQTVLSKYPQNIAPIADYFTDLQNGTLPQVAQIEPASDAGLDEHGSDSDKAGTNVQKGANYVSSLINAFMQSPEWDNSVFFFTYDENGGLYDHVSPQPAVSPDGIKPVDLPAGDICTKSTGPTCDFTYTGYRVPLIVVSPYTKKNYVSHTVADFTAILKFIETRYNLAPLTKRDAAQMDMTEFFDFNNPPWVNPPAPPVQATNGACYLDHLP
jgi:phospholipase C